MSDSPQSPPKEVEQVVQSPDEEAQMNDPSDPQSGGLAYEFEVKEQDRWLPIANGASNPLCPVVIREGVRCFALLWSQLHGYRLRSDDWHAIALPLKQHMRISIRPCPTILPPSRQRRLVPLPPKATRATNSTSTMLTYAILLQSQGS